MLVLLIEKRIETESWNPAEFLQELKANLMMH